MGGQGAFSVALRNPDYFTGAISFFGAFSYGEQNSPNYIATQESVEYMDYYTMYFICGNQDSYGFGVPAIELNQMLEEKGIAHGFFIENGGHDGEFYLPYFAEAFGYVRENMYQYDATMADLITGTLDVDTTNGVKAHIGVEAKDGIENYFLTIPDSSYTKEKTKALSLPLLVQVTQDGKVVYEQVERDFVIDAETKQAEFTYDFTQYVDAGKAYTVTYKVALFDALVDISTVTKN